MYVVPGVVLVQGKAGVLTAASEIEDGCFFNRFPSAFGGVGSRHCVKSLSSLKRVNVIGANDVIRDFSALKAWAILRLTRH